MSNDPIRNGIQKALDSMGDGWTAAHYIVCLGLERVTSDGELETCGFWLAPPEQADYITDGLLMAVEESRSCTEVERHAPRRLGMGRARRGCARL